MPKRLFARRGKGRAGLLAALLYLFAFQALLAPLAGLRMQQAMNPAFAGVICHAAADPDLPAAPQGASHACCDASCLLRTGISAAPPPDAPAGVLAPLRIARPVDRLAPGEDPAPSTPRRPQSPRAPPAFLA